MSSKRTAGGFALNPITWPEIAAWMQVTGTAPRKWELDAIAAIDDAYRASMVQEK